MSKPSLNPPAPRTITWVPKFELSIHAAVAQTPEDRALVDLLEAEWREKLSRGVLPEKLVHDPLQINADKEVEDGRHRLLAALRIDEIKTLPCEIVESHDPEALVCEKLLQRRHYSKSARAYALRHMAAKAAKEGRESRASMGGFAKHKSALPIESAKQGTLESLAAKSGLSRDILEQAVKLETSYMVKADKLIADWLSLNPEDAEAWQTFQDTHPTIEMPWSAFRAQALAAAGLPNDAASIHTIPKHWREIEEDKIFNGITDPDGEEDDRRSYSLGSALKAMGSYFATAGEKRNDLNPENPALYLTLKAKVGSFSSTMWKQWSNIDPAGRMEVIKEISAKVVEWPEDVRRAMSVALMKSNIAGKEAAASAS
ncbi:hypothetical protein [Prosthecobacter sp.]|uniref:hypothetical protein n=1 Tax=Prosthecobacter sp. TaxID=1965333 RepID=UPI0037837BE1